MIKALIFDFDGVIHDTLELAFGINQVLDPSVTLEEYKDLFNGNIYEHKKITPEVTEKFFALQHEQFKSLRTEREIKDELIDLKSRYELFIITSNRKETLDHYFENNGLLNIFTDILGQETHASKEEKFKLVFEKHGMDKDDCMFITDTLGDLLEANNVGVRSIAVDYGYHEKERLLKGKPLRIISKFSEISVAVKEISAISRS